MDEDSHYSLSDDPREIKKFLKHVSFRELFDFYIESKFRYSSHMISSIPQKVYHHIEEANMRLDFFLMTSTNKNIDGKPIQVTYRKLFEIYVVINKYFRSVSFRELFDNYIELRYGEKCIEEIPEQINFHIEEARMKLILFFKEEIDF